MSDIRLDDEVFNLTEAAAFLKKSSRKVRALIKAKRLIAGKSEAQGKGLFEILKSACLEYIHNQKHNQAANAEDGHQQEGTNRWRSNNVTAIGTATLSSRTVAKGLGDALTRQIGSKRRNSMIS